MLSIGRLNIVFIYIYLNQYQIVKYVNLVDDYYRNGFCIYFLFLIVMMLVTGLLWSYRHPNVVNVREAGD